VRTPAPPESRSLGSRSRSLLDLFRDPATTFLIVGGVVGIVLCFLVPRFAGIDESGHFARAYQLQTGQIVPVEWSAPPGVPADRFGAEAEGGGACLPTEVIAAVRRDLARYQVHQLTELGRPSLAAAAEAATHQQDHTLVAALPPCGDGERFFRFASFAWYSPVPYLPAAVGVGLADRLGGSVGMMLLAGRVVALGAYLAIVYVAIRRSPVGRWALAITALLPAAMFQAATSLSPDALTIALSLLVISSALRMTYSATEPGPMARLPRAYLVEAGVLSIALGLCKPSYAFVALCYLLPLIGARRDRSWWALGLPVVAGIGVSALWQSATEHLFICDSVFFGVQVDPGAQRHAAVTEPWRLVGASCRALADFGGDWTKDLAGVGDRVVGWSLGASLVVLALFMFLAVQRDTREGFDLSLGRRGALLAIALFTYLAVIVGWVIYCEAPPLHVGLKPHARLFVPLLALVPLALSFPLRSRAGRLASGAVPLSLLLVPFEAVWLVALAVKML
jgi:hypothetical protein